MDMALVHINTIFSLMGGVIHVVCKRTVHSNAIDFIKTNRFVAGCAVISVNAADFIFARWGSRGEVEHKRDLSRRIQPAL
jgi:hypothetical protein